MTARRRKFAVLFIRDGRDSIGNLGHVISDELPCFTTPPLLTANSNRPLRNILLSKGVAEFLGTQQQMDGPRGSLFRFWFQGLVTVW